MIRSPNNTALLLLMGLCLTLPPSACTPSKQPSGESSAADSAGGTDQQAYLAEIDAWRKERIADLSAPDGWRSLIGLYWLQPGDNTFGAGADNAIVFPPRPALRGQPSTLGNLILRDDGSVLLRAAPESGITAGGSPDDQQPVTDELELVSDIDDSPTLLELGALKFHVIDRGGEIGLRLRDTELVASLPPLEIQTFPVDPALRLRAHLEPSQEGATLEIANIVGQNYDNPTPGTVVFTLDGKERRIEAVGEGIDEPLFLIVGDLTNGHETYPGGRYLYAPAHREPNGEVSVDLDLNRLYNPPCVFSEFATCPLPPRQNRLDIRVEAGERWQEKPLQGGSHAGG